MSFIDQILICQCNIMNRIIKVMLRNKPIIGYEYISHAIIVTIIVLSICANHTHLLCDAKVAFAISTQECSTEYPKDNLLRWLR